MSFASLRRRMQYASLAFVKPTHARSIAMLKRKPLIDAEGEVREVTAADLKSFHHARSALPEALRQKLGVRGPQKAPTKERITIRLSPEVVERFRATGEGWHTRLDAALKDWLKNHNPAA